MGREVKRVALSFSWPINKVWEGYINHFYKQSQECHHCEGSGCGPLHKYYQDQWYGKAPFKPADVGREPYTADTPAIREKAARNVGRSPEYYGEDDYAVHREALRLAQLFNRSASYHITQEDVDVLVEAGRLWDFTRDFVAGTGWVDKNPPYVPTADEVNAWNILSMGHDGINCSVVCGARAAKHGEGKYCPHCEGTGRLWPSEEAKKAYDDWERTDPEAGEGYQVWETVSEGSPLSPVFADPRDLATYMAESDRSDGLSAERWLAFIVGPGWAPSGVLSGGVVLPGVAAVTD